MIRDKDDAEDIVQQAFISLWQKMDQVEFRVSARSYLYKTVYNGSLDFLKHKKVAQRFENDISKNRTGLIHPLHGEEKELKKKIRDAIDELPGQCGKIFIMSRIEGLKYREIALALNLSENTVENQMGRALKLLRASLKEYFPLILILINCWIC